ncbi:MAG: pantetheine-phosphate adenylyltransferase [Chloroflexota bacterium]
MRQAIVPGSFDPVTYGHLDIIERAARIFDVVWAVVFHNPEKNGGLFSIDERLTMLREATGHIANVRIDASDGLLTAYARAHDIGVVVKGLRAFSDFEYEFKMALMNKRLDEQLETLFMMTATEYAYVSSSVLKEVCQYGGSVRGLVPPLVEQRLEAKFRRDRRQ